MSVVSGFFHPAGTASPLCPCKSLLYLQARGESHSPRRAGMDLTPLYMLVDITGSDTAPWDSGINYTYPEIACQPIQGVIGENDLLGL